MNSLQKCLAVLIGVAVFLPLTLSAQELVISEFVAANAGGLLDEDGEASDWIEIFNSAPSPVSLTGWTLTDDAALAETWIFPDVTIGGHGFVVVFASGKDRRGGELHTNFSLSRDGENLALMNPQGGISSSYSPAFPGQRSDTSYGLALEILEREILSPTAGAHAMVPLNGDLGLSWVEASFDDTSWTPVSGGVGYDRGVPAGGGSLVRADASRPGDLIVATSNNSPGGEGVAMVIDDSASTKYLNLDELNTGFTLTLSRGAVAVDGLRFTSANDSPDRDPGSFVLSGSNDGATFTEIASGVIPNFVGRFETVQVDVENEDSYLHYRLIFPTVRNSATAVAMQIAEVEFLAMVEEEGSVIDGADVTAPGDVIVPTSYNSPAGEGVENAIDGLSATKYLNFDKLNAGFTVTPAAGQSVVDGLRLTSANDADERDPASYLLEGSSDGSNFVEISRGTIPGFTSRFQTVEVRFTNTTAYRHYRLTFPGIKNAASSVAMQIAEVEFLGRTGESAVNFSELISSDIEDALFETGTGVYVRLPFEILPGELPVNPVLRVWYDDGFVAYLNGVEVARRNAPELADWNAVAASDRSRLEAVWGELIDLSGFAALFQPGANVLALHGLNEASGSDDFLLRAGIFESEVQWGEVAYFANPTPGSPNPDGGFGIVGDPVVSVERGFFQAPFSLELSAPTEGAVIRYTTDGSEPTLENGESYVGPLTIDQTTILRVAALRDGWLSSEVVTQTYLFAADVVEQTRSSALAAGLPGNWNSQSADYGLDPRVAVQPGELLTIPTISIVLPSEELFGPNGIYANPEARGDQWEREISFEWLDTDGGGSFQEGAGMRIQGGAFRRFDLSLKKSLRVVFREKYGASKLKKSIFGPDAAAEVDSLVLRANGNDAWKWGGSTTQYIRDAFAMETMRAMGNVASHSGFAHLYLNGQYWGVYNPTERPDAAFSSVYHGGSADSWDALNQDSVPDGNSDAWNRLIAVCNAGLASEASYQKVQGNNPDGTRNPDFEVLVDVDNLIDYMMLNFYLGNNDWPHRNHWYGINRDGDDGFQFYPWDSETALGLGSGLTTNRTGVSESVARPYAALRQNPSFRLRFADRVQKHFFNGGVFHVDPANPAGGKPGLRYAAIASGLEEAIAGESARWGDQLGSSPYTREGHWRPELESLLSNYFPQRSAIVLAQFRAAGLYPMVDAPVFSRHGGTVPAGFEVVISTTSGETYFTTDGTDPRNSATARIYSSPVVLGDLTTVRARALNGGVWSALAEARFTVGVPRLVVSELDYHPGPPTLMEIAAGFTDPDDFEFIELWNPGAFSFDLTGVHFTDGVEFDFTRGTLSSIPPGGRVLVVSNLAAFTKRYGTVHPVVGAYSGKFANNGEHVEISDANGNVLASFAYSDSGAWPSAADGGGASLVFRNAEADPGLPESWSVSGSDPTPGGEPGVFAPELVGVTLEDIEIVVSFAGEAGVVYELYGSDDLADGWALIDIIPSSAATGMKEFRFSRDAATTRRFFRIGAR